MTKIKIDPDVLIRKYNEESLKIISSEIILIYKNENWNQLHNVATYLDLSIRDSRNQNSEIFKKIILFFHPDRRMIIHKKIKKFYLENNLSELRKLEKYIKWKPVKKEKKIDPSRFDFGFQDEEYDYDYSEFTNNFDDYDNSSYWEDSVITEEESNEYGFIEVVKQMMYGNITSEFLPKDLYHLDGELNLSNEGIEDLDGLRYCENITKLSLNNNQISNLFEISFLYNLTSIDLSKNEIDEIDSLSKLNNLISIDLSFNNIESISPIINLPNLKYVNLIGNNIKEPKILEKLQERCMVII